MNAKTILAVVLACGVVALAGCSSMSRKGDPSALAPRSDIDQAYVQRVNSQALSHGYQVIWLNPPSKQDRATRHE